MNFLLLIIIPMLLGLWAQMKVKSAYKRYSQVPSRGRVSGREAAEAVMQAAGIRDVAIVATPGTLTDHYDPSKKQLALSEGNYNGTSIAALGVAAHEAGHAIQHKVGYSMLNLRMALVPITMFSSKLLPFVILGGFFFKMMGAIWLGIGVYMVLTIFQMITLPVEFDASKRAKEELAGLSIVQSDEMEGVRKTLDAAAWTYVAAFVASLGNLLYLLSIVSRNR
ncbi:MAG: peptidase [Opitutales bacterium]|nr:peptidase [Opitutales bacterium]